MSVVFTFPGQGAQYPRMLADLPDHETVADTLATAADALDEDVRALDTENALADTRAVQIVLTVTGVAAARYLIAHGAEPSAVMGLSIGAWPAAVMAGAMDFADAIRLVAERGRLMAEAYPEGYGMGVVLGLSESVVVPLLDRLNKENDAYDYLYLANINADQQIVVAGADADLARLIKAAQAAGARCASRLNMAVPSHCPLMDEPAENLAALAGNVTYRSPNLAYFSANRRRRLWNAEEIREDLVHNMARPVRWSDTARIVDEAGFRLAVEMPPGHTLTGLHPAVEPPGEAIAVADTGWDNAAVLIRRAAE